MLLFINSPRQWAWWAPLFQGINVIHRQPEQPPPSGPRGHSAFVRAGAPLIVSKVTHLKPLQAGEPRLVPPGESRGESEWRGETQSEMTAGTTELFKPPGIRIKEALLRTTESVHQDSPELLWTHDACFCHDRAQEGRGASKRHAESKECDHTSNWISGARGSEHKQASAPRTRWNKKRSSKIYRFK